MILENDMLRVEFGRLPFPEKLDYKTGRLVLTGLTPNGQLDIDGQQIKLVDIQAVWQNAADCLLTFPNGAQLLVSCHLEEADLVMVMTQSSGSRVPVGMIDFSGMPLLHFGPEFSYAMDRFSNKPWHSDLGPGLASTSFQAGPVIKAWPEAVGGGSVHACAFQGNSCCYIYSSEKYLPLYTRILPHPDFPYRGGGFELGLFHGTLAVRDCTVGDLFVRICFCTDQNGDGLADECDYQIDLKKRLPDPNPLYRDAVWYKIYLGDQGRTDTSYAEALEIISRVSRMTNRTRQIIYLVGFQDEGHDSCYPGLDTLNPRPGSQAELHNLIRTAREQFNALVSLHINLDDAYQEHADWDPAIIAQDINGSLMQWELFNKKQSYHINHTMDVASRKVFQRLDKLLAKVPVKDTIHIDAFRNTNFSWQKDGFIGPQEELYCGMLPILAYLRAQGIDPTTESQNGMSIEMAGVFSSILHNSNLLPILSQNKVFGGGQGGNPTALVKGSSLNSDYNTSNLEPGNYQIIDEIAERNLLYRYFQRRDMIEFRSWINGSQVFARFADQTTAFGQREPASLKVFTGETLVADLDTRFVPLGGSIFVWHRLGGRIERILPPEFRNGSLNASLTDNQGVQRIDGFSLKIDGPKVQIDLEPHALLRLDLT